MQSGKVIDLRRRPPSGQQRLFAPRPPAGGREPERRPMPLRVRRRRARALIALAFFLLCAGFVWGIGYASYLPQFSISSISVTGVHDVSEKLIRQYAQTLLDDGSYHLLSRSNILLYPREVMEKAIVGFFPRIRSVHVSREALLSRAVMIAVVEREPYALWCATEIGLSPGACYLMDDGGFIYARAPEGYALSNQYVFRGALASTSNAIGSRYVAAHLPGLVALLRALGQAGYNPQGASIESERDFSIPLGEGFYLKASFGAEGGALTRDLELVVNSDALRGKIDELEYVDLRFGNRVYYKLKGATAEGKLQNE